MKDARPVRKTVLVLVALALIGVTTVLLLNLRQPVRSPAADPDDAADRRRQARPAGGGALPSPSSPRAAEVHAALPVAAAGSASTDAPQVRPAPAGVRFDAPEALPAEILSESDPARKAELLKMHRLSTARVRVAMLRRRQSLLQSSLDRGRQQGSWSPEKIREAERQLQEVTSAALEAQQKFEEVRQQVGGDIDKGAPW